MMQPCTSATFHETPTSFLLREEFGLQGKKFKRIQLSFITMGGNNVNPDLAIWSLVDVQNQLQPLKCVNNEFVIIIMIVYFIHLYNPLFYNPSLTSYLKGFYSLLFFHFNFSMQKIILFTTKKHLYI